ncbi:MAG: hypothetical protein V4646_13760 [Pseudomonadota bacterium]
MKIWKGALALSFSVLALPQAVACFMVYNAANQLVYSGMSPPMDMSYQIHERLPAVFPGGHMVFGDSAVCSVLDTRQASPVLTNVSIASAAVSDRPARTMSRAERNRAQDALTK